MPPLLSRSRYAQVLAVRDFRLLVLAFLADAMGSWAYTVVLAAYIYDETQSTTYLAVTGAVRFLPGLLLSPLAGVLADRYDKRMLMIVSALGGFTAMTGLALGLAAGLPIPLLLVFSLVNGVFAVLARPASGSLTPELVGEARLGTANALLATLDNLVVVLGPALGAVFLLVDDPVAGVQANALTFLGAAVLLSRMHYRRDPEAEVAAAGDPDDTRWQRLTVGFRALAGDRTAAVLVLFSCLTTFVFGMSTVLFIPISQSLGTGSEGYGYLLAGSAVGGVLVAGAVDRLAGFGRLAPLVVAGMLLLVLPYSLTVLTGAPLVGFLLQVVSGAGMVVVDVLAITAIQRDLPRAVLGRVLGVFEAASPLAALAGSLAAAPLLAGFGLDTTLVVLGAAVSALTLLLARPLFAADRRSAARAAELAPTVALLEVLDLMETVARPALERLAAAVEVRAMAAGEEVITEGEPADAFWVLVDGEAEVTALDADGIRTPLRVLGPRSYAGEIGLLRGSPRTATVTLTEDSVLWRIPGEDFLAVLTAGGPSPSVETGINARLVRSAQRTGRDPVPAGSEAGAGATPTG